MVELFKTIGGSSEAMYCLGIITGIGFTCAVGALTGFAKGEK